jgi:transcriptional regulator with XRE-family HTH domain
MTQQQGWAGELHHGIAAAIRRARDGRMSAQELADETARLGYPVSRSQIANYESGRKQGLDVAELLVLAAALNVPPGLLLFPGYPLGDVEFLPGRTAEAVNAVDWFSGDRPLATGPGVSKGGLGGSRQDSDNAGTVLVSLVNELSEIAKQFKFAELRQMRMPEDADRSMFDEHVRDLSKRRAELLEQIDKLSPMFDVTGEER